MKKYVILLVTAVLFVSAPIVHGVGQTFRWVIPKSKLQSGVAKQFPLVKDYYLLNIVVTDPSIQLRKGSDKVGLDFNFQIKSGLLGSYPGKGTVESGVLYNKDKGALYMDRSEVTKFELKGLSKGYDSIIRSTLSSVMRAYLAQKPVYELDGSNTSERMLKKALQSVKIENGEVVATVNISAGLLGGLF